MAIEIGTDTDDRMLRANLIQESRSGRFSRTMMGNLEQIDARPDALFEQLALYLSRAI